MSKLDDTIENVAYILDTLMAYRNIAELGSCHNCGARENCKYVPKLDQQARYNCPLYEKKEPKQNVT